ncbi:MAG: SpaA isopeptide-forming pilin-related protein [Actinomycetaceae bacterium]|nr:SpaA isopeptide-forming pilin-related protein [Actinomycetaceae bacterium]
MDRNRGIRKVRIWGAVLLGSSLVLSTFLTSISPAQSSANDINLAKANVTEHSASADADNPSLDETQKPESLETNEQKDPDSKNGAVETPDSSLKEPSKVEEQNSVEAPQESVPQESEGSSTEVTQESEGNSIPAETVFRRNDAANPFSCVSGSFTYITRDGVLRQVGPEAKEIQPIPVDFLGRYGVANSLGISKNGEYAFASVNESRSGVHTSIYKFANGKWRRTRVHDERIGVYNDSGAIDISGNGDYYFGGYENYQQRDHFKLYRFDVRKETLHFVGRIPMQSNAVSSGDMAFDRFGNLSIIRGIQQTHNGYWVPSIYTVTAETLRESEAIASRGSDAVIWNATYTTDLAPADTEMSGIAFDDDGLAFVSGNNRVTKYNLVTEQRHRLPSLGYGVVSSDIASCAEPPTIRVKKLLPNNFATDDKHRTFTVQLRTPAGGRSKLYGEGNFYAEPDNNDKRLEQTLAAQTVGPFIVPADATYNLKEIPLSGTYFPKWSCEDQTGTAIPVQGLASAAEVQVHLPAYVNVPVRPGASSTRKERPQITCTVVNYAKPYGYVEFSSKIVDEKGNSLDAQIRGLEIPFSSQLRGGTLKNGGKAQLQLSNAGKSTASLSASGKVDFSYLGNYRNGSDLEFAGSLKPVDDSLGASEEERIEYQFIPGTSDGRGSYCDYTPRNKATERFPLRSSKSTLSSLTNKKHRAFKPGDRLVCTFAVNPKGSITLKAYDKDIPPLPPLTEYPIAGAKFELFSSDQTVFDPAQAQSHGVGETSTGTNGGTFRWSHLPLGKNYFLVEQEKPKGYEHVVSGDEDPQALIVIPISAANDLNPAKPNHTETLKYQRIRYVISWRKVDFELPDNLLPGSAWVLNEVSGLRLNLPHADTTGNAGQAGDQDVQTGVIRTKPLPWGTYRLRESTAPKNYTALRGTISLSIDAEGNAELRRSGVKPSSPDFSVSLQLQSGVITVPNETGKLQQYPHYYFDVPNLPARDRVLLWEKVDAVNNKHLSGSAWILYTDEGETLITDCTTNCPVSSLENGQMVYRDSDPAAGKFKVEKLRPQVVRIKEHKAPAGYQLRISAEQPLDLSEGPSTKSYGKIKNTPISIPVLPLTGGTSTDIFYISAFLLLLIALGTGIKAYRSSLSPQN